MTMRGPRGGFPLFKGCTRLPTIAGVPLVPLMVMLMVVAGFAMIISLWWWALILPFWVIMAQITRYDDKAFRILGLWLSSKVRNRHKDFWQASTYNPTPGYRRHSR